MVEIGITGGVLKRMSLIAGAENVTGRRLWRSASKVGAVVCAALLAACHSPNAGPAPSIEFTRIPQADSGGREKNDIIEGVVKHARAGQRVVLYARSGRWWVQPLLSHPFTNVRNDSKWTNATHLGTEYAAILVGPAYRPASVLDALPRTGSDVLAVASAPGGKKPPSPIISFSGYEWRVRNAPSSRGGVNRYDASNAWTDGNGAMHLRIAKSSDDWTCAEVSLTRSLGYGTYRFVVRDTTQLESSMALGIFTWDYASGDLANREMDIELRNAEDHGSANGSYVVQPYYVAANVSRFSAPKGRLTHAFRWEPGRVSFSTVRGTGSPSSQKVIGEHVFTHGVPAPGIESVRMNLYLIRAAMKAPRPTEVVIEKFEYLP